MSVAIPVRRAFLHAAAGACVLLVGFVESRAEAAPELVIAPRRTAPSGAPAPKGGPAIVSHPTAGNDRAALVPPLPGGTLPTFVAVPTGGPFAPRPIAPYWPFGFYDFSRGPYSRYMGLFGYRGGYRSMYYINGGYSFAYGPTWRF